MDLRTELAGSWVRVAAIALASAAACLAARMDSCPRLPYSLAISGVKGAWRGILDALKGIVVDAVNCSVVFCCGKMMPDLDGSGSGFGVTSPK